MKAEQLIGQIETYSNAIVGFAVLQAIGYGYYFGSNEFFNCLVKSASYLAPGLSLLFLIVMVLFMLVIRYCRNALRSIGGEYREMVDRIYLAKMIAVVLFSLVPLSLTLGYGVLLPSVKIECNKIIADAQRNPATAR